MVSEKGASPIVSSLNVAIEAMNLTKEISRVTAAKAVFVPSVFSSQ